MDSPDDTLVLGIDFKISVERRCIEVIEPTLVAPKNTLQCTSRDEVDTDSKIFFDAIDRRALFIRVINEIQKYDWGMISTEAAYQINIPGYDVSYYYADSTSLKTHILKYYLVCHFVSNIAAAVGEPLDLQDALSDESAPPETASSDATKQRPSRLSRLKHLARPVGQLAAPLKRWTAPIRQWTLPQDSRFPVKALVWYGGFTLAGCALVLLSLQLFDKSRPHPRPNTTTVASVASTSGGPAATTPGTASGSGVGGTGTNPFAPPLKIPPTPLPVVTTAPPPSSPTTTSLTVPPISAPQPAPSPPPAIKKPDKAPLPAEPPVTSQATLPLIPEAAAHGGSKTLLLQKALATLGYFHGEPNGLMGPVTRKALADFISVVPPDIARRYGPDSLPMAEAALRGEFPLLNKGHTGEP